MSKRENGLKWIRLHGYHDERASGLRVWLEHRISRAEFDRAWNEGRKLKEEGAPCTCSRCCH